MADDPHKPRLGRLKYGGIPADLSKLPRCGAKTRKGTPCQRIGRKGNGRCKLHGGLSTGPKTPEGLARSRKANWKHGRYSEDAVSKRRTTRELIRQMQELLGNV